MTGRDFRRSGSFLQATVDLAVTLVLWSYYTVGFAVFFSPFYLAAGLFSARREAAFQRLNHRFYRGFFFLVRVLMPGHRWHIPEAVRRIRSSVIVCNHISYLDPILLISLYEKHRTIVKSRLFRIPLFGRMLAWSGYMPSSAEGRFAEMMIDRIETMGEFLEEGGNLFVFPEGTRSRDGRVGRLSSGVFKIARTCRVPVRVLFVRNTDRMFRPGVFSFNTRGPNAITVEKIGDIDPGGGEGALSATDLMNRVEALFEARVLQHDSGDGPEATASEEP